MKKLTKMPIDVEALLSSNRLEKMRDFQRWWYLKALFKMWNQIQPGYLELNGQLWTLLDSHSSQFFYGRPNNDPMLPKRSDVVVECFQVRELDGKKFLYSQDVERRWHEAQKKYARQASLGKQRAKRLVEHDIENCSSTTVVLSISSQPFEAIYNNCWKPLVAKPRALKAIKQAIEFLLKEKLVEFRDRFGKTRLFPIENEIDAAQFLTQAVAEFRDSPAGRAHGLFPGYSPPQQGSWFSKNAQRFLDDRSGWYRNEKSDEGAEAIRRAAAQFSDANVE